MSDPSHTAKSPHGLLVVDKPSGVTSRDIVNRVQSWFPQRTRVGHAGTLDPLATGVLVLCIGTATRLIEYIQEMEKVYLAGIHLGAVSDTDDADGRIEPVSTKAPELERVRQTLSEFVGVIEQVPPVYSASKVFGKRAYDLARLGEEVSLRARRVRIDRIELLRYEYPHLEIEVECGKGTYIRSLARDLGTRLGCGAYVESLRRLRVGVFSTEDAVSLDLSADQAMGKLLPMAKAVARLPRIRLSSEKIRRLRCGQMIHCRDVPKSGVELAVFDENDNLVALAGLDARRRLLPKKVLAPQ
ncbi:MAG: tRNA pseudouridine synthase B [Gemmatales bacterium]|nr:MAG: tRNA pseudouridine synthase B [Gemmatales bacterium]